MPKPQKVYVGIMVSDGEPLVAFAPSSRGQLSPSEDVRQNGRKRSVSMDPHMVIDA